MRPVNTGYWLHRQRDRVVTGYTDRETDSLLAAMTGRETVWILATEIDRETDWPPRQTERQTQETAQQTK